MGGMMPITSFAQKFSSFWHVWRGFFPEFVKTIEISVLVIMMKRTEKEITFASTFNSEQNSINRVYHILWFNQPFLNCPVLVTLTITVTLFALPNLREYKPSKVWRTLILWRPLEFSLKRLEKSNFNSKAPSLARRNGEVDLIWLVRKSYREKFEEIVLRRYHLRKQGRTLMKSIESWTLLRTNIPAFSITGA